MKMSFPYINLKVNASNNTSSGKKKNWKQFTDAKICLEN